MVCRSCTLYSRLILVWLCQVPRVDFASIQINSYGYGRLTAVSKNELLWEHVDAKTRNVTDYVRIEKA